jgi:hypothetical protein
VMAYKPVVYHIVVMAVATTLPDLLLF